MNRKIVASVAASVAALSVGFFGMTQATATTKALGATSEDAEFCSDRLGDNALVKTDVECIKVLQDLINTENVALDAQAKKLLTDGVLGKNTLAAVKARQDRLGDEAGEESGTAITKATFDSLAEADSAPAGDRVVTKDLEADDEIADLEDLQREVATFKKDAADLKAEVEKLRQRATELNTAANRLADDNNDDDADEDSEDEDNDTVVLSQVDPIKVANV